jgi:LmbE family N-acetylglucosaminyl deacetylase
MARLAAVYAHPDDDTFGIGGLLALRREDLDYTLIVATSGEAGQISDPSLASRETLGRIREDEERQALRTLGIEGAAVHFLGYPDGGLEGANRAALIERVVTVLRAARPHVVVTFGPEGVTRHADHTVISQVATEAFHEARVGSPSEGVAFQRLFYNAIPESDLERFWEALRQRGVEFGSPDDPYMPRGVPDHTITACVDCRSVVKRKIEAIRAHRTQGADLEAIPEDLQEQVLARECFVQAWPPVSDPEGPTLSDPFDGIRD